MPPRRALLLVLLAASALAAEPAVVTHPLALDEIASEEQLAAVSSPGGGHLVCKQSRELSGR